MLFEYLDVFEFQVLFKPLIILCLYFYYKRLETKKALLYEAGLLFAFISNILFLDRSIPSFFILWRSVFFRVSHNIYILYS